MSANSEPRKNLFPTVPLTGDVPGAKTSDPNLSGVLVNPTDPRGTPTEPKVPTIPDSPQRTSAPKRQSK